MPEEKRTFESETLPVSSLHFKRVSEAEGELGRRASTRLAKRKIAFSREVILRLIEWLEQR